jgi:hypothetical protein
VLAARTPRSFLTFPPTQCDTEDSVNRLCARVTGVATDYCYGPFLLWPGGVDHLSTLDSAVGWGWRTYICAIASRLGLPIEHVTGDFDCPADERDEDRQEQMHRLRQLAENVTGLVRGLKEPIGTPMSSS